MRELLDVVYRPEVARKFRSIENLDVSELLRIVERANIVTIDDVPAVSRDPKDDVFLATARVAGAQYLVSEDEDLLVLGTHGDVRIVTAAQFLSFLEQPEDD